MPGDREIESCRDVYLQSCASICEPFKADGFLYAKSGPKMSKKSGEFTFTVSFQSSRYNRPGVSVCIGIHAYVYSPAMKKWRSSNRSIGGANTCLAGGQIGNLRKKQSWMEWDVASTELRGGKIQLAIEAVRNIVLPYFAAFEDVPAMCERLEREEVPSVGIEDRIDFLARFASTQAVQNAVRQFVAEHEDEQLAFDISRALNLLRRNEQLDRVSIADCRAVARAIVMFDLDEKFVLSG
ncbi:MAG: hypothetical protein QG574_5595 [Cyanobacteriota bacterium erpe_2018_sw_21hr_WHONDRS-SW48-000092_B_bin.40]|jgi:hypothetical protein|nr:hypothetical protein [Cyanobacteriota bacterium erpe_2018_sw_21hr_WHONDRS-SW48-000092_B_bin.40]